MRNLVVCDLSLARSEVAKIVTSLKARFVEALSNARRRCKVPLLTGVQTVVVNGRLHSEQCEEIMGLNPSDPVTAILAGVPLERVTTIPACGACIALKAARP